MEVFIFCFVFWFCFFFTFYLFCLQNVAKTKILSNIKFIKSSSFQEMKPYINRKKRKHF